MARLRLDLPTAFPFETKLTIRVTDLNYGGHLGNDAILGMIHEARVRFLKNLDYGELNIEGLGILLTDCAILYRAQGFLGEEIRISVAPADFTRTGCDFFYLLQKDDGSELARGKTGIAFFDYPSQSLRPVPDAFRQRCGA